MARRALVCAVGSGGDVFPFIGIARALAARGVDTTMLGPARYKAHAAGIDYRSIGADDVFDDVFDKPDVWTAERGLAESWRYYGAAMRSALPLIRSGWDSGDTVLVGSSFALATRLAEELDGFRNLTVHLSPSIMWSAARPPRWPAASIPPGWPPLLRRAAMRLAETAFVDPVLKRALNPLRRELGLAPVNRVFSRYIHGARVAYAFPQWFAPAAPDWPRQGRFAGFILPPRTSQRLGEEVEAFANGERPLAVITAGTAVARRPAWVERATTAALAEGMRVLLVTRDREAQRQPEVLPVPWVPLDLLLPRARLLVHHGGIGTIAEALRAGVPQIAVPCAHDQHDNAAWLELLGAGLQLGPGSGSGDWLRALDQVCSGRATAAAHDARNRIRAEDGAAAARIAGLALA